MIDKLLQATLGEKKKHLAYALGGMGALLVGRKIAGITMFASGIAGLEKLWREAHPEFQGTLEERWAEAIRFYEETHSDKTNRTLHIVGIPMIAGGAVGLLLFSPLRPLWLLSAGSFTTGWVLNFIGHGVYEKKAPAFADDPLSFFAGPVWDFKQIFRKGGKASEAEVAEPARVVPIGSHPRNTVN